MVCDIIASCGAWNRQLLGDQSRQAQQSSTTCRRPCLSRQRERHKSDIEASKENQKRTEEAACEVFKMTDEARAILRKEREQHQVFAQRTEPVPAVFKAPPPYPPDPEVLTVENFVGPDELVRTCAKMMATNEPDRDVHPTQGWAAIDWENHQLTCKLCEDNVRGTVQSWGEHLDGEKHMRMLRAHEEISNEKM